MFEEREGEGEKGISVADASHPSPLKIDYLLALVLREISAQVRHMLII